MGKVSRAGGATVGNTGQDENGPVLWRGRRMVIKDGSIEFLGSDGGSPDLILKRSSNGTLSLQALNLSGNVAVGGTLDVTGTLTAFGYFGAGGNVGLGSGGSLLGFYGTAPAAKPAITGSRGANAALASLLTQLAALGLITDSSS